MKYDKKAISMEFIIIVIISLITLFIISIFISDSLRESNYASSILTCNMFIKSVDGKPVYFEGLNSPSNKLIDTISQMCSSKTIKINSKEISKAADLIKDCYIKTGEGEDFFGANAYGLSVCIYCGKIKAKQDIDNFGELLKLELKKDKYKSLYDSQLSTINLNQDGLNNRVPKSISQDSGADVYYLIYRPDFPQKDFDGTLIDTAQIFFDKEIQKPLSEFLGNSLSAISVVNYQLSSSGVETYSAVIIEKELDNTNNNIDEMKSIMQTRKCHLIVPAKNFD